MALSLYLFTILAAAGRAEADCPSAGVAGVHVAFIDLDQDGVPDVEASDKKRNEHARISSSLAAQLGVSVPSGAEVAERRPRFLAAAPFRDLKPSLVEARGSGRPGNFPEGSSA